MRIAVLGCGAIGGLFLGYLAQKNHNVVGIIKDYQKGSFLKEGVIIEGVRGNFKIPVESSSILTGKVDLAVMATKINDLEVSIRENARFIKDAYFLTTQNGLRADYILNKYFPKENIISGIVMFGATFYPPNKVVHNFEGDLVLGGIFGANPQGLDKVSDFLKDIFNVVVYPDIKGAKYLKIFVNLNNCLSAILGVSMQEAFSDLGISELAVKLNKEAYEIVKKSNISLASLPNYPKERLEGLVSMPVKEARALFSKIMISLSKEPLYGSILQSIQRGKKSEIDYINGEIVRLAKENNLEAPLNEEVVNLVHKVENSNKFFSKEELLKEIGYKREK